MKLTIIRKSLPTRGQNPHVYRKANDLPDVYTPLLTITITNDVGRVIMRKDFQNGICPTWGKGGITANTIQEWKQFTNTLLRNKKRFEKHGLLIHEIVEMVMYIKAYKKLLPNGKIINKRQRRYSWKRN